MVTGRLLLTHPHASRIDLPAANSCSSRRRTVYPHRHRRDLRVKEEHVLLYAVKSVIVNRPQFDFTTLR
jgi:hypothetical protein